MMNVLNEQRAELLKALQAVSSEEKAISSRRYFPDGFQCLGVNAGDIKRIITTFHAEHKALTPEQVLAISEQMLEKAIYNEEVLLAFGLLNKFVKKQFDDRLLQRFEYWLETYCDNWSQVDDLCIKTLYQFMLSRPHLITSVQAWSHSQSPWCRRASNVAWVKFIQRKIGKEVYCLDQQLVFQNCDLLLNDDHEFVQKSIGWLLKVTAVHHLQDVIGYIEKHHASMPRSTLRYAIEKMDSETRKRLLGLGK